jgi:hypothetical protein
MHMFTFFLCQPDGSAASFEARSFANDQDAVTQSRVLLGAHSGATMVSVWDGDRSVHEEWRCDRFRALPGFSRGAPLGQARDICEQCASSDCTDAGYLKL